MSQTLKDLDLAPFWEDILATQEGLVLVVDRQGVIRFFNHACELSTGRRSEDVLGQYLWDITATPELTRRRHEELFAADVREAGPQEPTAQSDELNAQEGQWLHRDGQVKTITWRRFVVRDDGGAPLFVVATGNDVTALRESERRWRWLSAATIEGITHHEKGVIVDVNARCAEMFGYTEEEMVGQSVLMFATPESEPVIVRRIQQRLEGAYEVVGLRKDGSTFPLEIVTRETRVADRQLRVAGLRDVSERKKVEERLVQAQRLESVGHMAGGIAHDFNNLLSVILGYAQSASLDPHMGAGARSDLEQVVHAATVASDLTAQLLVFARSQPLAPAPFDVRAALLKLEPLLGHTLKEDVALRVEPGSDDLAVRISAGHFEQVVLNLTLNARDAMPRGGALRISARGVTLDHPLAVTSGEIPAGEYLSCAFADEGVGIPEELVGRVFEPFFSTRRESGHSGLGLAVVYGVVIAAAGGIQIDSVCGQGTTITVYLPRCAAAAAQRPHAEDSVAPPGRVLVVEDQGALLRLLGRVLTQQGHTVVTASSAEDAMEKLAALDGKLDLLVTDVILPGLSGPELADLVVERFPTAAVLFMSGFSSDVLEGRSLEPGQFLAKPFSFHDFIERVAFVLNQHAARLAKQP